MATEAQIQANRLNATKSTGPRTLEGKNASRRNALKHGMAGAGPVVVEAHAEAFAQRLALWSIEHDPRGPQANWAMQQAVAASLTIDGCRDAMDEHIAKSSQRAYHAWDADRRLDAADVAARLAKDPKRTVRKLETTYHGVEFLIESWSSLGETLAVQKTWDAAQRGMALDLLGVDPRVREADRRLVAPEGTLEIDHLQQIVATETARLQDALADGLEDLDRDEQKAAVRGHVAITAPTARLIARYEAAAWRNLQKSLEVVRSSRPRPEDKQARAAEQHRRQARIDAAVRAAVSLAADASSVPRPTSQPQPRPATARATNFVDVAIAPTSRRE